MVVTLAPAAAHLTEYEPVIGLEVHVQLLTATKIFCSCSTRFGDPPNTNTCPVCLGLPGALPVLNRKAVEFAALAAAALGCRINETSIFARKNYFYPDLPKGFQISQYDKPLAESGSIDIPSSHGSKKIGITRVHLEEDAGKSLHDGSAGSDTTAIDLNRSGVPLIEIVSEPEIASPQEAYEYLNRLKEIILYTGVSDCNMEEGSLRCDANISVRPRGQRAFGTKTEIKNVNSFRFIRDALEYEIRRQIEVLASGGAITQETRLYSPQEGKTYSMRSKEQAHDYRYFPEPDLLPLLLDAKRQAEIQNMLPELPEVRRNRLIAEYGISAQDAAVLTGNKILADQFERAAKAAKNPKRVAGLVQNELMGRLKAKGLEIEQSPITMAGVAISADLVESGAISGKMLKDLYDLCFERGQDFPDVYQQEGRPQQSSDTSGLEKIVAEVFAANPKQREQYRGGKETLQAFFVGQVMKASKGQANPQLVNRLTRYPGRVPNIGEKVEIEGHTGQFEVVSVDEEHWRAEVQPLSSAGASESALWGLLRFVDDERP
jgi:aspartyl-tRNA(Asn)/glutamyl-tRNA(Gln) amidotransferase subunit B